MAIERTDRTVSTAGTAGAERLSGLAKLLLALTIIGAINWGLIGIFNWNLVDFILGGGAKEQTSGWSRIVYTIVGLAGLALALLAPKFREYELPSSRRVVPPTTTPRTDVRV